MADLDLNPDYRDLLVAMVDAGAEFVLIGGWAVAVHGYVRGTDDLDILVRPSSDNASRVFQALAAFGAPVAAHSVTPELFAREGYGYRMGVKPNLIEVLTLADGITFDDAITDHLTIEVDGRSVPVIGRAALLQNKRAAGRTKDLADLEGLGVTRGAETDPEGAR